MLMKAGCSRLAKRTLVFPMESDAQQAQASPARVPRPSRLRLQSAQALRCMFSGVFACLPFRMGIRIPVTTRIRQVVRHKDVLKEEGFSAQRRTEVEDLSNSLPGFPRLFAEEGNV